MIRFDNVSKRYESGLEALKRVNFELEAGEMAFLTGPSGAGKSTLLKLLMLMERPSSGNIIDKREKSKSVVKIIHSILSTPNWRSFSKPSTAF